MKGFFMFGISGEVQSTVDSLVEQESDALLRARPAKRSSE